MEERFYLCEVCGNLAIMAIASGVTMECCGEKMTHLQANTSDGDMEKHIPVVTEREEGSMRIKVGSKPHPSTSEHHIKFICLQTDKEVIIRYLMFDEAPEACIRYTGKPVAVYSYCNIHGLWKTTL